MVPVKPSELLAVVPTADDNLATKLLKTFVRFPILFYKIYTYMYNSDGTFTQAFADDHCKIECPTVETTATTT